MPRVRPAVEADHPVVVLHHQAIDELALALVAPLKPDDRRRSGSWWSPSRSACRTSVNEPGKDSRFDASTVVRGVRESSRRQATDRRIPASSSENGATVKSRTRRSARTARPLDPGRRSSGVTRSESCARIDGLPNRSWRSPPPREARPSSAIACAMTHQDPQRQHVPRKANCRAPARVAHATSSDTDVPPVRDRDRLRISVLRYVVVRRFWITEIGQPISVALTAHSQRRLIVLVVVQLAEVEVDQRCCSSLLVRRRRCRRRAAGRRPPSGASARSTPSRYQPRCSADRPTPEPARHGLRTHPPRCRARSGRTHRARR